MKDKRKTYIAPVAELILLAPWETLATNDNDLAIQQWAAGTSGALENASIVGGNTTYWNEDGTITTQPGG